MSLEIITMFSIILFIVLVSILGPTLIVNHCIWPYNLIVSARFEKELRRRWIAPNWFIKKIGKATAERIDIASDTWSIYVKANDSRSSDWTNAFLIYHNSTNIIKGNFIGVELI